MSGDLPAVIDASGARGDAVWYIKSGECAVRIYEFVATDAVRVVTDDLTPVVDTVRFRLGRTRHIDVSEVTVLGQEAVPLVCIVIVEPNNLTPGPSDVTKAAWCQRPPGSLSW